MAEPINIPETTFSASIPSKKLIVSKAVLPFALAADLVSFRGMFPEFDRVKKEVLIRSFATGEALFRGRGVARLYLVAHLLELALRTSYGTGLDVSEHGGEVTSVQIGDHRLSYMSQAVSTGKGSREVFFTRTEYGRTFLEIQKRTGLFTFGARVV